MTKDISINLQDAQPFLRAGFWRRLLGLPDKQSHGDSGSSGEGNCGFSPGCSGQCETVACSSCGGQCESCASCSGSCGGQCESCGGCESGGGGCESCGSCM